jgi:endonuclease-3
LIDKHGGKVPQSFEFQELPAVGHKTAGVVMSQALVLLLSGRHIHRLMYR